MALDEYKPPFKYPHGDDNDTVRAALTSQEKDALIETLETKVNELTHELKYVKETKDTLAYELTRNVKYRRLDGVRVAQKYLEASRNDSGDLIGIAVNIARFVESGNDGSDKTPRAIAADHDI